jgi:UPF0755 protein
MSKLKITKPKEKRRLRKRNRKTVIGLLIFLSPIFIFAAYMWFNISSIGSPGKKTTVEIVSGSSVSDIGNTLEANGIVNSGTAFSLYSKISTRGPYQAGKYEMRKNIGASAAADVLEKGPKINYDNFTIIPGERLVDVANNIGELPGLSVENFNEIVNAGDYRSKFMPQGTNNLEGFLLPETYRVSAGENEGDLIRNSLQSFEARAQANGLISDFRGLTPYQVIIVASLIEKEARFSDDRTKIASVIYNRLEKDMLLQIDATVLYGLGKNGGALSLSDLEKDTPYNTYLHKGLPSTPISMISMDSLLAALNPADTTFLFYVLTDADTGEHKFANTYEEHLVNISDSKSRGVL